MVIQSQQCEQLNSNQLKQRVKSLWNGVGLVQLTAKRTVKIRNIINEFLLFISYDYDASWRDIPCTCSLNRGINKEFE